MHSSVSSQQPTVIGSSLAPKSKQYKDFSKNRIANFKQNNFTNKNRRNQNNFSRTCTYLYFKKKPNTKVKSSPVFREILSQKFRKRDVSTVDLYSDSLYVKNDLINRALGINPSCSDKIFIARTGISKNKKNYLSVLYNQNLLFRTNFKRFLNKNILNLYSQNVFPFHRKIEIDRRNINKFELITINKSNFLSRRKTRKKLLFFLTKHKTYARSLTRRNIQKIKSKGYIYFLRKSVRSRLSVYGHKKLLDKGIKKIILSFAPEQNYNFSFNSFISLEIEKKSNQVIFAAKNNKNILNSKSINNILLKYKHLLISRRLFSIENNK